MKKTLKIALVSLAFPDRDLSPALTLIKRFARLDERIAENVDFTTRQFLYTADLSAVYDELLHLRADLYAFSCYVWNTQAAIELCGMLKEAMPKTTTLLGGPEPGPLAENLLAAHPYVDMIVAGEGELPFRSLLLAMLDGGDFARVPNLCRRDGDGLIRNPLAKLKDLTEIPSVHSDSEYTAYLESAPRPVTAALETARGCPFRCRYCSWGNTVPVRFRAMDDIKSEFRLLLAHPKVRRVYITDGDLLINKRRAKELLEFLVRENPTGKQVVFEMNPELLDDETIALISGLKSHEFAFGLQSTSPQTLATMNRRFRPERYRRNVVRLREACPDAEVLFSLIVGLPRDTLAAFKESLDFAISMRPHSLYIHDFLCLPGSDFHANQEEYGIRCSPEPPHLLVGNETFPQADLDEAKWLGYHVSLLHYVPEIVCRLWSLRQNENKPGLRLIDLFDRFCRQIEGKIDLTCGRNIADVASFEFDAMYARTVGREGVRAALLAELDSFTDSFADDPRTVENRPENSMEAAKC